MINKLIVPGFLLIFLSCNGISSSGYTQTANNSALPITEGLKHSLPKLLKESSGLCFTDGNLWTFGDSGNPNEIYKIDTSTGAVLQTIKIENFPNIDWEDITADSFYMYIGDFGNNNGNRKDLKIIRINKSDLRGSDKVISLKGEAINFSYNDQTDFSTSDKTDFDCEAVIAIGDFLYIFSKDGIDFKTRCYKISKKPGTYTVSPISYFNTNGKITAAAYNSVTREIALLGYMSKKSDSFIWFLDGFTGDNFFSGKTLKVKFGDNRDWQTEGIDYVTTNRLFMSCESSASQRASLYFIQKN